jgi:hypothetical protein
MKTKILFIILLLSFMFNGSVNAGTDHDLDANVIISSFGDSSWNVLCTGTNCNGQYYMHLRADGKVGYNFSQPADFDYTSSPAAWQVKGRELFITWANGDLEIYQISDPQSNEYAGQNKRGKGTKMTRLVLPNTLNKEQK